MANVRIKALTKSGAILEHKVPPPYRADHVEQIPKPAQSIGNIYALTIGLRRFGAARWARQ
jgi:hypothetical protein